MYKFKRVEHGFKVESALQFISRARQPETIINHVLSAETLMLIGGKPGCGKTWFALEMAIAVATGEPFMGKFTIPKPKPVLIIAEDAADWDYAGQFKRVIEGRDMWKPIQGCDNLRFLVRQGVDLYQGHNLLATLAMSYASIQEDEDERSPGLVILDSLRRLQKGDENDSMQMANVMSAITFARKVTGCAFVLLHHTRKPQRDDGGPAIRGSGEIEAASDTVLRLQKHKSSEIDENNYSESFTVNPERMRGVQVKKWDYRMDHSLREPHNVKMVKFVVEEGKTDFQKKLLKRAENGIERKEIHELLKECEPGIPDATRRQRVFRTIQGAMERGQLSLNKEGVYKRVTVNGGGQN